MDRSAPILPLNPESRRIHPFCASIIHVGSASAPRRFRAALGLSVVVQSAAKVAIDAAHPKPACDSRANFRVPHPSPSLRRVREVRLFHASLSCRLGGRSFSSDINVPRAAVSFALPLSQQVLLPRVHPRRVERSFPSRRRKRVRPDPHFRLTGILTPAPSRNVERGTYGFPFSMKLPQCFARHSAAL